MNNILVTGSRTGLGKFLTEELNASAHTRENNLEQTFKNNNFDYIIHCAFNSNFKIFNHNFANYYEDNIGLTSKLLQSNYKKFIFISSIDVYPQNLQTTYNENTEFLIEDISSLYGKMKFMCETLVKSQSSNHLIIRPSALLGPYMKKNNIIKLLFDKTPQLTLAPDSTFNLISYHNILDFITYAINQDIKGTYNFTNHNHTTINNIAHQFSKTPSYGKFKYITNNINNKKLASIYNKPLKDSMIELNNFYNYIQDKQIFKNE